MTISDGFFNIGQDWTLSDSHIGKADDFSLYTIVKTWHMDFKAFEGCLILFEKKPKMDFDKLSWWEKFIQYLYIYSLVICLFT